MTHPGGKSQARLIAADFISLCFFIMWIGLATGVILAAAVLVLSKGAAAAEADAPREAMRTHQLATRYASVAGTERAPLRFGEERQQKALAARPADVGSDDEAIGKLGEAAADWGVQFLIGAALLSGGFLLLHFRRRRLSRARLSLWTYPTYPDPDVPIGMESALPAIRRERLIKDPGAT